MATRFSPPRGAAAITINSMVRGPTGAAGSVEIGAVTMLAPGATPTVANVGTVNDAVFDFGLPGTPTITPGAATALNAGSSPTVVNSGTSTAQVYDFGIPRGADAGMRYSFEASTTMAAPASGGLRFDNASIASVANIAVNASNADGVDVSDWIATWDESTNATKGYVVARKEGSGAVLGIFSLTSVTDNTSWLQLEVTFLSGSGSLSASDRVYLTPFRIGDKGVNGTTAISGTPTVNQFAAWVDSTTIKGVSITGIVKGNGASAPAAAVAGTDYLAPPSGTAILKANSGGALANATAGTDYCAATSGSSVLKGNSGNTTAATAGTDYVAPGTATAFTAQQGFTLATITDQATLAWTVSSAQKAKVTIGASRTMGAVTGAVEGYTYVLWVIQGGTGSYTITWTTSGAGSFDFGADGAPTLTTTVGKADLLCFESISIGGTLKLRYCGIKKGFG